MEENEVQQEGPVDNSFEKRKKSQMEMLEKAPLGTYWKYTWKDPSMNKPGYKEYYHIFYDYKASHPYYSSFP